MVWLFAFHLAFFFFPSFACMPLHHLPSTARRSRLTLQAPHVLQCTWCHTASPNTSGPTELPPLVHRERICGDGLTASCVPQTPSNPGFCRKFSALISPPPPVGRSLHTWEIILGALSVAVELTVNKGSEVSREFGTGLAFPAPLPTGSGWSLLKTSREMSLGARG